MTKKSQIIIDGYNLLKSAESGMKKTDNLEFAREKLLRLLNSSQKLLHHEIIVVFDSYSSMESKKIVHFGKIKVVFSGQGMEADDLIRNWIRKKAYTHSLTVVSSDNEIKHTARDHGARVMDSKEFWITNRNTTQHDEKPSLLEKERNLSDREVKEWLKLFQGKAKNREKI